MHSAYQPTRLTAYALIAAIEEDIRGFLLENLPPGGPENVLPSDAYLAALYRRSKDVTADAEEVPGLEELLNYCDFGDLGKTIYIHKKHMNQNLTVRSQEIADRLEHLIAARNRVAHSRPLESDDFPALLEVARWIVERSDVSSSRVERTLHLLDHSPGSLLYTEIPPYWQVDAKQIENNLPTPEFYETGFVGRQNDRERIARFLRGAHPIISIIGNGGVGKTALAQICLYDLLDPTVECPYHAIVWISLKTERLTHQGVEMIRDRVQGSLPILQEALDTLGGPEANKASTTDLMLEELRQYMTEFNVLLALDNCEATSYDVLKPLLEEIPAGSKLLMTSRTGFGAYEVPYTLTALEEGPAQHLFRVFARSLNVGQLAQAKTSKVSEYCKKLFFNPLAIKWFVASVAGGSEPKDLLAGGGKQYEKLVEFCFSNVFESFDEMQTAVVDTIMAAGRPLSRTELCLVIKPGEFVEVDSALNYLRYCSIIEVQHRVGAAADLGEIAFYGLSEFARQYARVRGSKSHYTVTSVRERLSDLRVRQELAQSAAGTYRFQWNAVHPRNHDERLVAAELQKALGLMQKGEPSRAIELAKDAAGLKADFGEPYRILAHIYSRNKSITLADDSFRQAVDIQPDSDVARYHYGHFMLDVLNDYDGALDQFDRVLTMHPEDFAVLSSKAKTLMRLGILEESTEIWENLLSRTDEVAPRRARMTVDQAAEAYRRWAEADRSRRDVQACGEHLGRALSILEEGMRNGLIDSVAWKRIEKVFTDTARAVLATSDSRLAHEMVGCLKVLRATFSDPLKMYCDCEQLVQTLVELGVDEETARAMDFVSDPAIQRHARNEGLAAEASSKDGRKDAVVSNVPEGKNFAFARDSQGNSWFFHKNHLENPSVWSNVVVGKNLSFGVGTNEQGPCAIDVRLE